MSTTLNGYKKITPVNVSISDIANKLNNIDKYEKVEWRDGLNPSLSATNLSVSEDALESLLGNDAVVGTLRDVITSVSKVINLEIDARKTDIDNLNTNITTVTQTLSDTDIELQKAITDEITRSKKTDTEIENKLTEEIKRSTEKDDSLSNLLESEVNTRSQADIQIESKIPTKVSQLLNDKNYLTEHQSLEGKADKIHQHRLADITDYTAPDLSTYVTAEQLNNYYTKTQTDTAIQDAIKDIVAPDVNLSEYAKKSELPTKVSQLENDKGYLTSHQSLSDYYTKSETNTQIQTAIDGIDFPETDLSEYYTKSEISDNTIMNDDEVILYCGHSTGF